MDASRISALTTLQLEDVAKAATAHRPVELLDVSAGGGRIHIEAISDGGRTTFGEWDLHLQDGTMFLRIIIDDILWGGGARTVSQVLASAKVVDGDVVLTFGSHSLTIDGLTSVRALADDLVIA